MFPDKIVHNEEIQTDVCRLFYVPDTPLDESTQLFNEGVVRAGVVEHHNGTVLNVVKPPLGWYKPAR